MVNFFEVVKDKFYELKNDPNLRKYFIAGGCCIGGVAVAVLVVISGNLRTLSLNEGGANAGDLIDGNSATVERNSAGGIIADIDWEKVIGYDRDGNPIYGTHGMVPAIGGYDMCGAPILAEDLVVTGYAEDGLPIYGNYSAIDQARIRGLNDPSNTDIDWNSIVGYDIDGNPIFGTFGADPNILGYDLLGNPIYKGSVTVSGHTDSGVPIYNYSTINVAKANGVAQKNALNSGKNGDSNVSSDKVKQDASKRPADKTDNVKTETKRNGVLTQYVPSQKKEDTKEKTKENANKSDDTKEVIKEDTKEVDKANEVQDKEISSLQQKIDDIKSQLMDKSSLKGDKGEKGEAGATGQAGVQGTAGAQGPQGMTGAIGPQGNAGVQGAKGETGATGKDGASSYTYIRYAAQDPAMYPSTELLIEPTAETKYMGVATSSSAAAPSRSSDYAWSQYKDLSITAVEDADGVTTLVIQ